MDISGVRSCQLIQKSDHTSLSGSTTSPAGFTEANCFVFALSHDGKASPAVDIIGTSVLWETTVGSDSSTDFSIYILRYK